MILTCVLFLFFFKQKTAYEFRISDWSSDVCSSDLLLAGTDTQPIAHLHLVKRHIGLGAVGGNAPGRVRRQADQRLERRAGLTARLELEHLAEQDKRDDHGGRLEVDAAQTVMSSERDRKSTRLTYSH